MFVYVKQYLSSYFRGKQKYCTRMGVGGGGVSDFPDYASMFIVL
jgi:hypothetical protein